MPETANRYTQRSIDKLIALGDYLMANGYPEAKDTDEMSEVEYDDCLWEAFGNEYMVLTDSEAGQRAADYIRDSLWAFNASFLSDFTGLPEEVFTALQDKCEEANETVEHLIEGCGRAEPQRTPLEVFVGAAISADGRGHFMSSYDGNENEQGGFYIYRTN